MHLPPGTFLLAVCHGTADDDTNVVGVADHDLSEIVDHHEDHVGGSGDGGRRVHKAHSSGNQGLRPSQHARICHHRVPDGLGRRDSATPLDVEQGMERPNKTEDKAGLEESGAR